MTASSHLEEWPEYLHLVEVVETVTYLVEWCSECEDPDEAVAEADECPDLHEYRHHNLVVDSSIEAQHPGTYSFSSGWYGPGADRVAERAFRWMARSGRTR